MIYDIQVKGVTSQNTRIAMLFGLETLTCELSVRTNRYEAEPGPEVLRGVPHGTVWYSLVLRVDHEKSLGALADAAATSHYLSVAVVGVPVGFIFLVSIEK